MWQRKVRGDNAKSNFHSGGAQNKNSVNEGSYNSDVIITATL